MTVMLDQSRVEQFMGQVITDAAAAISGLTVALGDRLGLYEAMAGAGPLTSTELAGRTALVERYVREWLACQVAGGYVEHDPADQTYTLPDEHAAVLADPLAPTYLAGAFLLLHAAYATEEALLEAFRTGAGVGWDAHPESLFTGTAKFFRPGYLANILGDHGWLAALDGVEDKLIAGASVADLGCGFGYSTLLMAEAFPASRFVGFDYHRPSIEAARALATDAGVGDRVRFEVASAHDFPGTGYDLLTCYDCLHDMGDPGGAAAHARAAVAEDGTWMIVEPNASENLADTVGNPIARLFTAASVAICLPAAMAQGGPVALGNHAGEDAVRDLVTEAGWSRWRRATETPVNRVYEARP
ncbi:class I SAM-dependent methyltransferase [Actinomycetospora sp.]|uniref:class I SAM-dependent methyltransferase n=1 Tax=Actinomycetospora sp. TaxID=1872135 RepID=UPI002F3F91F1